MGRGWGEEEEVVGVVGESGEGREGERERIVLRCEAFQERFELRRF